MITLSVYLSGRFARKDELSVWRDALEVDGFSSCTRWLDGEPQDMAAIAAMDEADVRGCDILIAASEEPVEHSPYPFASRGGRHIETGMALALGRLVVVVGPREPVFHHLARVIVFPSWPEARAKLGRALAIAKRRGLSPSSFERALRAEVDQ